MADGFYTRLSQCMKIGDLGYADLHHWFERPRPTVRLWIEKKTEAPRGPAGKLAFERLILLERAIAKRRGMPVPRTLSALERPKHIKRVRDGLERTGVPQNNSA